MGFDVGGAARGGISGGTTGFALGGPIGAGVGAIGGSLFGGFFGGGPDSPDFAKANQQQTLANRPDQFTPFGFSQWHQDPQTGKWTQNTGFSPMMQGLLDQGLKGLGDVSTVRDRAEQALYGRQTRMLDPQWEARLADTVNSGAMPGDPAYNQFTKERNDAYGQAQVNSILGGGQEAQLQEQLSLNPFLAMNGAARQFAGSMPQFNLDNSLGAAIAQGNFNLGQANINAQQNGDMFAGLGQLGAAAIRSGKFPFQLGNAPA